jgi:leucyl/phenylalanyl-tRNA--protein transferase
VSSGEPLRLGVIEPPPSRFTMPDPRLAASGDDLIAIGADLAPGTLLAGYRAGLFPMPVEPRRRRSKIAWYSPDPRGIIPIDGLHVSRSMRRSFKRFDISVDTSFVEVMQRCGDPARPGRWITDEIISSYAELYNLGWAHSIEVWRDDRLVGGLYGVGVDGLFAGESMFHLDTDASKAALMALVDWLRERGAELLDVQWTTPHLSSLGAIDVPRNEYLTMLDHAIGARRHPA